MNCKKLLKQIIFVLCVLFVIAASLLWLTDHARNKAVPVSDAAPSASQSQSVTIRPGPASYSNTGLTVRFIDVEQADTVLITTENHVMLIDGAGKRGAK